MLIDKTQALPIARVTIDDVRTALDGTDPNKTNAAKVRALLGGRGSFETIQKHLTTLRQELATAAAPPVAADQLPAMPTEVTAAIAGMWQAAYSAAQVATLRRSETLAAERDAALLKLETMTQDVAELVATVDSQADQVTAAVAARAAVEAELERQADEYEKADAAREHADAVYGNELAKVRADAAHAAELAQAGRELMRQELERLTDQVGELKAALYKRVEVSPAPLTP